MSFLRNVSKQILNKHTVQVKNIQQRLLHDSKKCWKCGATQKGHTDLFCKECSVIQNPQQSTDYFKVFQLSEEFEVNQKELTKKYRHMQSLLHPDKFTNKAPEEKLISEEFSSLVNKAYSTLQAPLSRALHLLLLHNERIGEDDKASDPQFLMEIMELNEEVEEANTLDALKALNTKNGKVLEEIAVEIAHHFKNNDIKLAKDCVVRMKYYYSLSKRINELLRERGIVD